MIKIFFVLFMTGLTYQQQWKNDKIVRPWELTQHQLNGLGTLIASKIDRPKPTQQPAQPQQFPQQIQIETHVPPQQQTVSHPQLVQPQQFPQQIQIETHLPTQQQTVSLHQPIQHQVLQQPKPQKFEPSKHFFAPQSPSFYRPIQPPVQIQLPSGPYLIQQQTITSSGETIIENLIGGIHFDCSSRPTGHWRDTKYCDVFHACVFGQQKKTYSCPYVGEHTYFDDFTHKCEFVRANPSGCNSNSFFH